MAYSGSGDIERIKSELRSIISELEDVERHLRSDFKNVGNEAVADCIGSVITKYESTLKTLNSVAPSMLDKLAQAAEEAEHAPKKQMEMNTSGGGGR